MAGLEQVHARHRARELQPVEGCGLDPRAVAWVDVAERCGTQRWRQDVLVMQRVDFAVEIRRAAPVLEQPHGHDVLETHQAAKGFVAVFEGEAAYRVVQWRDRTVPEFRRPLVGP